MNVRDSENIAGLLESMGYIEGQLAEADLVLLNTCSVRHSAENKVYGKLGEINRLKQQKPGLFVAFGGCMAQLPEVRARLKKMKIDLVFGTHNLHELPELIRSAREGRKQLAAVWENNGPVVEIDPGISIRPPGSSAFVNIMYGCNNFCSYCIVPYTRGRERSRMPDDIVGEAHQLAGQGYNEITLLGQNVNSYGRGLDMDIDFAGLLHRVHEVEGIERIRFTTSHPKDVSDSMINAIADLPKCCEHIHVAMQAGSNRILKLMNRGYTREHYLDVIGRLRDKIPEIAISTDIIVGFPGETDADFRDTIDMVEKVQFDSAFTFMYSVRSGTRAAQMPDQLEYESKNRRLAVLNDLQYAIAKRKNQRFTGRIMEVMVDGPSKSNQDRLSSRTRCNRIVILDGSLELVGRTVDAIIEEAKTFSLFGRLTDGYEDSCCNEHNSGLDYGKDVASDQGRNN